MQSIKKFLLIFFAILYITGCNHKPAIVIENSKKIYNHQNKLSHKTNHNPSQNSDSANKQVKIEQGNQITVLKGETLFSISKKHNILMRDLIKENNLEAPYNLKEGDKLTIPKPNYYIVKNGDTLYSISRANSMNINNLIAINDLKEPYNVIEGQKLRINSENKQLAPTKTAQKNSNLIKKNNQKMAITEPVIENKSSVSVANNFSWPVHGKIISGFGPKKGGLYNDGVNIAVKENAPVKASESGTVAYVGNELKGYGNLIIIKHPGGFLTAYAHLSKPLVKRGQKVKKLEVIGAAGTTGNVTTPQLYFGLRKGRDAVNPQNYLKLSLK